MGDLFGGSKPKTPDYEAAAKATAEGNLEYAKYATQANRADQHTPWGSQTWTNDRVFNQEAYDNAMAAYQQGLTAPQTDTRQRMTGENGQEYVWTGNSWLPADAAPSQSAPGAPPNPEDFYTGGDKWTQNTTLSPQMQALFDQEMRLQQGMFSTQNAALDRVNSTLGQSFNTSGLPQRASALDTASLPSMGSAYNPGQFGINMNSLPGMGSALDPSTLSMPDVLDPNSLTPMGRALRQSDLTPMGTVLDQRDLPQMGEVLNRSQLPRQGEVLDQNRLPMMAQILNQGALPQMGEVFEGDRGNINTYDPNLQTNNATQLLMQQMDPGLERSREQLRTQLANQGIMQGSQAYNNAMAEFERSRNTAYRDAALQGIGLGMQQQSLMFNQDLANRNLTASEQAQRYQQQYGNRAMSTAEQAQRYAQQYGNRAMSAAEQAQRYAQQYGNRSQSTAEQMQQYQQQYGNRAMSAAEQNQIYAQMANNRSMSAAEQAQLFNQMTTNRQLGAAEQNQMYGQQYGNYGLGLNTQAQQFNQQQQLRAQEAQMQALNAQLAAQQQAQQFQQQQALRAGEAALQNQQFAQSDAARQAALAEEAYLRNLPMNELNALRTGNQVSMPQFPGYAQQATTGGPDLLGAANQQYQAQVAAANAQNAGMSGMFGGLMQMGGLGLEAYGAGLFSDRRLKQNIRKVGKADNGLNIYAYQYVWGGPEQIGYMADEVLDRFPHAVGVRDGYMTVDYGAL